MAIEIAPPQSDLPQSRKRLRDRSALRRLCAWGGSATLALAAVAIATQTESGSTRLQLALVQESPAARAVPIADIAPRVPENDAETQRLQAQIRTLAADRDHLTARIATLEHSLDDITGSIKRQAELAATPPPASTPPVPSAPAATPPVAVAPPAPSTPAAASAPMPPVITPLATPPSMDAAAPWPDTSPAQTATPQSETVPLPPARVAAAPASEPATEPSPPRKPEIGIDLGGGPNIAVLDARWAAVKANFGPLLTGLRPLAARARHSGATNYRLVVGPLPNAAAAAQLCTRFAEARVTCRPAKFDGESFVQR